jgi:hypothetical protein
MGMTVCSTPGCPTIHPGKGRCPTHAREYEQARGTAAQRGYGHQHRTQGDAAIKGATHCANCGQPFTTDNPVTRGHVDAVRDGGTSDGGYAAQCRRCNYGWRATGL